MFGDVGRLDSVVHEQRFHRIFLEIVLENEKRGGRVFGGLDRL